ncbi:hypothetical protein JMJ35_000263 [Cladonia borealis]|uniref:C2H2-type domain-containing protein n=1 Tax=Cladonia borealis TaxID=184061 RepID=A0AA39V5F7_9LECA|nr:hypothetical protein JMJ35_000263 [Cladonia borealis]
MLSYQISDSTPGRQQRQKSTPTTFDIPRTRPASGSQDELHKRGLSVDQLTQLHQYNGFQQQDQTRINVEHNFRQQLTQQHMREAQQQQQEARPGHNEISNETQIKELLQAYIMTQKEPSLETGFEHTTVNTTPSFDQQDYHHDTYNRIAMNRNMFEGYHSTTSAGNLDGFGTGLDEITKNIPTNELMNTIHTPRGLPSIEDSRASPSNEMVQRPCTPLSQTKTCSFPLTPETTPFKHGVNFKGTPQCRTVESSPTRRDPNLTIKASHAMQRGMSCQDNFTAMRHFPMSPISSPPRTAPLKAKGSIDLAIFPQPEIFNMSNLNTEMPPWDSAANYSPMSNAVSSTISSYHSSPEMAQMSLFGSLDGTDNGDQMASQSSSLPNAQNSPNVDIESSPRKEMSKQGVQSTSEADDSDNECIVDTGVTMEEVNSFITTVSESENQWMCLWPNCNQKFNRKENVKSHVQTHLDDRKYCCKYCGKCFVRINDRKRHKKIHSGIKPYLCPCGKNFTRHDALTRHRQRDSCSGAFSGAPKKETKRGRPKKTRPDTQERLEKSAKTRQRVIERKFPGQYSSSASESSFSSHPSPEQFFDNMDFAASSPSHYETPLEQVSMAPADIFSCTPVASPSYSTGDSHSPQISQHSYTPKAPSMSPSPKIATIPEEPQQLPASNSGSRKSSSSYFGTPPELDLSSSPIVSPTTSKFFDGSSEADLPEQLLPPMFTTMDEFFMKDFDLSASLTKNGPMKSPMEPDYSAFCNVDMWGGDEVPSDW